MMLTLLTVVVGYFQLINKHSDFIQKWPYKSIPGGGFSIICVTFGVYIGLAGLLMVILLWVLFTKCHLR